MKVYFTCGDCNETFDVPAARVDLVSCASALFPRTAHYCQGWALATCPEGHPVSCSIEGAKCHEERLVNPRSMLLAGGARLADGVLSHETVAHLQESA